MNKRMNKWINNLKSKDDWSGGEKVLFPSERRSNGLASKKRLRLKKPFFGRSPRLLPVLSETRAPYSTQSVWLAIGYILLVLEELDLGPITYMPSDSKALQEEMWSPDEDILEVILPCGVPKDDKNKEQRFSVYAVTHLDSCGKNYI